MEESSSEPERIAPARKIPRWIDFVLYVICACGILFILGLCSHSTPTPFGARRTEARNQLRTIYLAMVDFEQSYDSFPSAATAGVVKRNSGTPLMLGTGSSNAFFRQLFAAGRIKDERAFYVKLADSRKPDEIFTSANTALAPGECGFAYIPGHSSSDSPAPPVVMTPMVSNQRRFDPKPLGGKAVVLMADGQTTLLPVDDNGSVKLNGMDLFDSRQPFWHRQEPEVTWPE